MSAINQGHLLLIEDHHDIAEMVCEYLERCDYIMDHAADGITGLHLAVSNDYDAIILDLMLPGMDGIALLEKVRNEAKRVVPVLILTARDTLQDKVAGLDAGADDYLVKPFDAEELLARVDARLRRVRSDQFISVGDLRLNLTAREVFLRDVPINFTRRQFDVLVLFAASPGRAFSREEVLDAVWGTRFVTPRNVNEQIRLIRQRLKNAGLDKTSSRQRQALVIACGSNP